MTCKRRHFVCLWLAIILSATLPAMAQLKFTVTTDPYYVIPDQLLGTNSPPYPDFLTPAPPSVFCEKANSIHPCANPETIFCPFGCNCVGTFRTGIPQTFKDATSVLGFKSVYFPYGTISRYYHYVPGGNGYCMNEDESYLITEWGFVKQPSDSMPAKSFCNEVNFKYGNFFDVNTALCRNDANPERSMHTVISANTYFGNWQELKLMLEHCASQGVIVDAIVFGTEIRNDQDNSPITIVPDGDTIPYPSGTKYFNRVQRLYIDSLKSDPRYAALPLYFSIAARSKDQGGCVARTYSCEDSTGGNSIWNIELHTAIESYNETHPLQLRFAGAVNWWWYPVDTTKGILTSPSAINDMNDFFDMGLSSAGNALCYKYPGGFAEGSFTGFDEILVDQWGIKRYEICNVPYQNTFLNQVFILKRALNMFDNNYNRIYNPENSNGITVTHAFYDRLAKNDTYCPLDQVLGTDTWDTLNTSYYGLKQMNRFAGHKFKRAGFTGAAEQNLDAYFLFNCKDAKLVILNYSGTPYTIKKITVDTLEYKGSAKLDYEITSVSNTSTKGTLAGLDEISEEISYNNKKLTSIIIPGYSIITVHLTVIPQAGAAETCNGVDDDCDGLTDENAKQIFYPDLDGDGYGDPGFHVESCSAPDGFVSDNTDCFDKPVSGYLVHPAGTEICNNLDDNCNGSIDEGVLLTFYADADNDGYGNENVTTAACTPPLGYVSDTSDCNDSNVLVNSAAADICNNEDDNCNGVIDENGIMATVTPSGNVSLCKDAELILTANTGTGISYQWQKNDHPIEGALNATYTVSKAGSYSVKETNTFNCNATSLVTVVDLLSLPSSTISPLGSLDICLVGSVTLQANIGTGFTYQWLKSGDPIAGATNSIYLAVQAKTYKVIVTDSHGCSKTSKGVKVTKSCKVENDFGEDAKDLLTIYPNPTDGNFTVDLKMSSDINGKANIQVLNTIGQVIYEKTLVVENGAFIDEINLGNNPTNEIYLVRVIIDDKTFSREIVYQE